MYYRRVCIMYYVLCYYYSVHMMDVNLRDLLVLL